jgi:hypothetical protein
MGVVYQARHRKLKRVVALKMILSGPHAGPWEVLRFRSEAEAVARLQHPNIVQIYEVGEHDGLPFCALEFCEGGSLARKVAGTPLPATEAARLVETLARAVEAAHRQRVVHRDLKPANVLLTLDGTPKVTDFGLAKRLDEAGQTQSGQVMGTPSYMAPEQARGETRAVGPAADTWALGAILYELLTGRPPFKAATAAETILQVLNHDPVPPRRLQPRTPRDLETVCLKCLEKDPQRRYGSAEALAQDLKAFREGRPIAARPVGPVERAARWARRHPAAAALATVLTVGAVALLVGGALWYDAELRATAFERLTAEQRRTLEQGRRERDDLQWQTRQLRVERAREEEKARQDRADWRRDAYAHDVRKAHAVWGAGQLRNLASLLLGHEPKAGEEDLRGFEYRYLTRLALGPGLARLRGPTSVHAVAFFPDGKLVAAADLAGGVTLWEPATDRRRTLLPPGKPTDVRQFTRAGLAIDSSGRRLAALHPDGTARVWDLAE